MSVQEADRQAAEMQRRMQMANSAMPAGPPMPQRQRAPYAGPTLATMQPIPRPTPPQVPPVARLTGPNPKIVKDPADRYRGLGEKQSGSPLPTGDELGGVRQALTLVLFILLACSVFVIPREYRFFWLVIFGLSVVMMLGMKLYADLFEASADEQKDEDERKKLHTFAGVVLYGEYIFFAVVMAAILVVMAWKLYGQFNSRSNLLSNTEPATEVERVQMEALLQDPLRARADMLKSAAVKKKKRLPEFL